MPNPTPEEKVDKIVMERTQDNPLLSSETQQKKAYRALAVELQSRLDEIGMEVEKAYGNPMTFEVCRIVDRIRALTQKGKQP